MGDHVDVVGTIDDPEAGCLTRTLVENVVVADNRHDGARHRDLVTLLVPPANVEARTSSCAARSTSAGAIREVATCSNPGDCVMGNGLVLTGASLRASFATLH